MEVEGTLGDDRRKTLDAQHMGLANGSERYQPYRRAPQRARRSRRRRARREIAGRPRPQRSVSSEAPTRRRRRLFLLLTLLVVTAWGAVAVRQGDVELDELDEETVELLQALPPLFSQGLQWVQSIRRTPPRGPLGAPVDTAVHRWAR